MVGADRAVERPRGPGRAAVGRDRGPRLRLLGAGCAEGDQPVRSRKTSRSTRSSPHCAATTGRAPRSPPRADSTMRCRRIRRRLHRRGARRRCGGGRGRRRHLRVRAAAPVQDDGRPGRGRARGGSARYQGTGRTAVAGVADPLGRGARRDGQRAAHQRRGTRTRARRVRRRGRSPLRHGLSERETGSCTCILDSATARRRDPRDAAAAARPARRADQQLRPRRPRPRRPRRRVRRHARPAHRRTAAPRRAHPAGGRHQRAHPRVGADVDRAARRVRGERDRTDREQRRDGEEPTRLRRSEHHRRARGDVAAGRQAGTGGRRDPRRGGRAGPGGSAARCRRPRRHRHPHRDLVAARGDRGDPGRGETGDRVGPERRSGTRPQPRRRRVGARAGRDRARRPTRSAPTTC